MRQGKVRKLTDFKAKVDLCCCLDSEGVDVINLLKGTLNQHSLLPLCAGLCLMGEC